MAKWTRSNQTEITAAGSYPINLADGIEEYRIYSSGTISITAGNSVNITVTGTPIAGMIVDIHYEADISLANAANAQLNFLSIFGINGDNSGDVPAIYASTKMRLKFYYDGAAWDYEILPSFDQEGIVSADNIASDSITTAKILDEAVTLAKQADLTRGSLITGQTASNRPTALAVGTASQFLGTDGTDVIWRTLSGDATLTAGAITIANDAVDNNKLANITRGSIKIGGAANAPTDLAIGTSGQILVSDGTDPVWVTPSGDATLSSAGVITITSDGSLKQVQVTIPTAEVLTLNATPVTIIPAQGAGKYVEVVSASAHMTYAGVAYATNGILRLLTTGASIGQVSWTANGFLFGTATRMVRGTITTPTGATETQILANTAVVAQVDTGDPTAGTSDITITVAYRIIEL